MSFFGDFLGALGMAGGSTAQTLYQIQQEERLRAAQEAQERHNEEVLLQRDRHHRETIEARQQEQWFDAQEQAARDRRTVELQGHTTTDPEPIDMLMPTPTGGVIATQAPFRNPQEYGIELADFINTPAGEAARYNANRDLGLQRERDFNANYRAMLMAGSGGYGGSATPVYRFREQDMAIARQYLGQHGDRAREMLLRNQPPRWEFAVEALAALENRQAEAYSEYMTDPDPGASMVRDLQEQGVFGAPITPPTTQRDWTQGSGAVPPQTPLFPGYSFSDYTGVQQGPPPPGATGPVGAQPGDDPMAGLRSFRPTPERERELRGMSPQELSANFNTGRVSNEEYYWYMQNYMRNR